MTSAAQSSAIARAAALVVWLVTADLWAEHHFGIGVNNPGVLAGGVVILTGMLGWVAKLLHHDELKPLETRIQKLGRFLLDPLPLSVLYLLLISLLLTLASVRVINDTPGATTVLVTTLDDPPKVRDADLGTDESERFRFTTSPFGRPVRVEASGFVPATFTLYPLAGLTVRLSRDVLPSPSVYVRPGVGALRSLDGGGTLRVSIASARGSVVVAEVQGRRGAFLLGTPQAIPAHLIADWPLELAGEDNAVVSRTLLTWKRPIVVPYAASVRPGDTLVAVVTSRVGVVVAQASTVLGTDRVVDLPLTVIEKNTP